MSVLNEQIELEENNPKIEVKNLNFYYEAKQALFENNIKIPANKTTAITGPSGCGKSTHIRVYNRIYELYHNYRAEGEVVIDGINILSPAIDLIELRRRVGMIFPKPALFPTSVFENVAYGLRLHFKLSKGELAERVEKSLIAASLWDDVKDSLDRSGENLSAGAKQRLCIARLLALKPDVLLMDEPASAADPGETAKLEELIERLRGEYTIVIVTHNMQQAARISDYTAFFYEGRVVEFGPTMQIFTNPSCKETEDYITGRFG